MAIMRSETATQFDLGFGIEPIDPSEEPEDPTIHLNWPDQGQLDFDRFIGSYDRRSDTYILHFFGRGREAVSVEIATHAYALVDLETDEVVGLQWEGFLSHAVKRCPVAIELLDLAELRGITVAEVRELRREVLGLRWRITERLRHPIAAPVPQKRRLMKLFDRTSSSFEGLACI